ncbi:MAG TPA: hypothetical protein VFC29_18570 [Candidatus Limnocylindrales bacterium]|nr:hypothetical protein [Candidatus Limnocylindrales bacterium]
MPYCPYTDEDCPDAETSTEHIIPLSLGGVNGFEIAVHTKTNSDIGSRIDAAMAEDFLVKTKRDRFDVRGHSGKAPVFVVKEATNADGLPLQVALNQRSGLQVWSPRHREYVTDERASSLELKFSVKIDTAMKFVAKVALSGGYFVYGDLFRRNVKHSDFRKIMNFQPSNPSGHEGVEARVDDRFSESAVEDVQIFRALCKASEPRSIVGFAHSNDRFGIFVGILGEYIGTIHVPGVMEAFPKEGEHQMGHVIQLQRPGFTRVSMKQALESFLKAIETESAN